MRRTRHKGSSHNNNERWLLTYSDLITLLMIFFVIMFAMSQIDQIKFNALKMSLQAALKSGTAIPINSGSTSLIQSAGQGGAKIGSPSALIKPSKLDHIYQQVKQYVNRHDLQDKVAVVDQVRGVQITLRDVVLFNTGEAVIRPQAQGLLAGLVPFFQRISNPIVIEGYTDNVPIHTALYPSNWELSGARAVGVVRFLISKGVDPSRLSGVAYGQYHPVAPNNTPYNRQQNRRVNIVILRNAQSTKTIISPSGP